MVPVADAWGPLVIRRSGMRLCSLRVVRAVRIVLWPWPVSAMICGSEALKRPVSSARIARVSIIDFRVG